MDHLAFLDVKFLDPARDLAGHTILTGLCLALNHQRLRFRDEIADDGDQKDDYDQRHNANHKIVAFLFLFHNILKFLSLSVDYLA